MNNIVISEKMCNKCGKYIEECTEDILAMCGNSAFMLADKVCLSCGHCAAVYPEHAISPNGQDIRTPFMLKDFPNDIPAELLIMNKRRLIRNFKKG
jgi:MinD superfamily P-loop ATPase